ncbi:MAG: hypothetical protein C4308_15105, partial [Chitinophagaceae bacterium]
GRPVNPWSGKSSRGPSFGRDLVYGGSSSSSIGQNLGTHRSVRYNGTADYHALSPRLGALVSASAYFVQIVFRANAAGPTGGEAYNEAPLLCTADGTFYISYSVSGVRGGHYDNVAYRKTAYVAAQVSETHVVQMWFDGATISLRVDNGTPVTATAGPVASDALANSAPQVALDRFGLNLYNGLIALIITMQSLPTAAQRDAFLSYAQREFF